MKGRKVFNKEELSGRHECHDWKNTVCQRRKHRECHVFRLFCKASLSVGISLFVDVYGMYNTTY